jgi:hypothetical protein
MGGLSRRREWSAPGSGAWVWQRAYGEAGRTGGGAAGEGAGSGDVCESDVSGCGPVDHPEGWVVLPVSIDGVWNGGVGVWGSRSGGVEDHWLTSSQWHADSVGGSRLG